jgi:hypothetical protein
MNLTRLKKRETSRTKRERDVLEEYEFFDEIEEDKEIPREDDDMNDFIENDENDEKAREQAREALGIEDEEDALKEAFYILSTGKWPLFLESGVIQQWFKPVYVVLNSFGNGELQKVVNILWKLCWSGELKPKLLILGYQDMCICCGNTRHVQYELYYKRSGNLIGGIGTDCYENNTCSKSGCGRLRQETNYFCYGHKLRMFCFHNEYGLIRGESYCLSCGMAKP